MDRGTPAAGARSITAEEDVEEVVIACTGDQDKSLCVYGLIHDVEVRCLLDGGAERNCLSLTSWERIPADLRPNLRPPDARLRSVLGESIPVSGMVSLPLVLGTSTVMVDLLVAGTQGEVILGMPFNNKSRAVVDYENRELFLRSSGEVLQCYGGDQRPVTASVRLAESVSLDPGEEYVVAGRVHYRGLIRRLAVVEGTSRFSRQHNILVARSLVDTVVCKDRVPVRVFNPGHQPVEIVKGTFMGCLRPATAVYDSCEDCAEAQVRGVATAAEESVVVPPHVQSVFEEASSELSPQEQRKLAALLREFGDVFSTGPEDLGCTHLVEHDIVLKSDRQQPMKQPSRRMGRSKQENAEKQIQDSCDRGLARPSSSPWASPIVMVRKKDGDFRLCVDYRVLNSATVPDAYPIPRIGDTLDALSGSRFFSTLDLRSGYWQIPLSEGAKQKSAFTFQRGLWDWNVLPFGLCNGVATFQRLMDRVLHGLSWSTVLVYLDDVLVISQSVDQMLDRLWEVFLRLRGANLKLHPAKCRLFQRQVTYLGHLVSEQGIAPNPEKIKDVLEWPTPQDVRDVRQFLGLTGYYRRFVAGYSDMVQPLIDLTRKGVPFVWSPACEEAFAALKKMLTEAPILSYPRDEGLMFLDTDASDFAIGAVLSQVQDGQERVLAYASKSLSGAERNYCTTRRELLAVVHFATHFRQYLLGRRFVVRTDHSSLRWLVRMKDPMQGQFARWLEILSEFQFSIEHRAGISHGNADALSRKPCGQNCPCGIPDGGIGVPTVEVGVQFSGPDEDGERDDCQNTASEKGTGGSGVASDPDAQEVFLAEADAEEVLSDDSEGISKTEGDDRFGHWTVGELAAAQEADLGIGPVLAFRKSQDSKPEWAEYSHLSPASKAYMAQWDRLTVKDGVLRRWVVSKNVSRSWYQVVLPKVLRKSILEHLHDSPFGGHFGAERTLAHVQTRFYWYDMRDDVSLWCRTCQACASRARPLKKPQAHMGSVRVGGAFERVAIDVMGPLLETDRYHSYILVVSDYFTKWVEAYPLPNQTATVVADIVVKEWVPRFGVPLSLHSDQGTNFTSAVFKGMCDLMGIDKTQTTPFHPASDGLVERFNATLQKVLASTSDRCHFDWDLMIPFALMAYRATPHASTGLTPNMMVFGRELAEPVDLVIGLPQDPSPAVSPPQYVLDLRERLEQAHDIAREALGRSVKRARRYYDRKAHEHSFKVGDQVWQFVKGRKRVRGKVPKFLPHYEGPFVVKHVLDTWSYVIQKGRGKLRIVHHDDLKPYHDRSALEERWAGDPVPLPKVSTPPVVADVDSSSEWDGDADSECSGEGAPDGGSWSGPREVSGGVPTSDLEVQSDGGDVFSPDGLGESVVESGLGLGEDGPVLVADRRSESDGGGPPAEVVPRSESDGGGPPAEVVPRAESDGGASAEVLTPRVATPGLAVRSRRPRRAPDRLGQWVCSVQAAGSASGEAEELIPPPEGFRDEEEPPPRVVDDSWWSALRRGWWSPSPGVVQQL